MRKAGTIALVALLFCGLAIAAGHPAASEMIFHDQAETENLPERFAITRISRVNVRQRASQYADLVTVLQNKGTELVILDEAPAADHIIWYEIMLWSAYQPEKTTKTSLGWVRSDLVVPVDGFEPRDSHQGRPPSGHTPRPTARPTPTPPPNATFIPPGTIRPMPMPTVDPIIPIPPGFTYMPIMPLSN